MHVSLIGVSLYRYTYSGLIKGYIVLGKGKHRKVKVETAKFRETISQMGCLAGSSRGQVMKGFEVHLKEFRIDPCQLRTDLK